MDLALSYLRQAEDRVRYAGKAQEEGNHAYAVRQCQEAVELSLKACLWLIGAEVPKLHDVGPVLREERGSFPGWFAERVDELAYFSRVLRREREPSMYGDSESGLPPDRLYSKRDSAEALRMAEEVLGLSKRLLEEIRGASRGRAFFVPLAQAQRRAIAALSRPFVGQALRLGIL
ncbi:MAG: HEPN domain-containing protein [Thermoprotei archaeon]